MSLVRANISACCLLTLEKQTAAIDVPAVELTEVAFCEVIVLYPELLFDVFSSKLYMLL